MKKIIIASVSLLIFAWACKKDANPTTNNLELKNANIAGKYKTSNITFTPSSFAITVSVYDSLRNCQKDDIQIFDTLNTYTYIDAGDTCAGSIDTTTSSYELTMPDKLTYKNVRYLVEKLTTTDLIFAKDTIFKIKFLPTDTVATPISGRMKIYLKRQ
jgi:hypothetical protein